MRRLQKLWNDHPITIMSAVFVLVRLPFLSQQFLLHDERDISFSGYVLARTARDLNGVTFPFSFNNINPDNPLFAIWFSALSWLMIPVRSVFFARLPYVLITALLPFLVYRIVKELTGQRRLSITTAALFCFSPWVFHLTRLAMDINVAIVALLTGVYAHMKNKRWITWAMFIVVFYSYQGFRILIPFLALYLEYYHYLKDRKRSAFFARISLSIVLVLALFASIAVIDAGVTQRRFGQVVFLNGEKFAPEVIFKRMTSVAPTKLRQIFHNKLTVQINYVATNFVKGQDMTYLFKEGDYSPINGNGVVGQYLFPFILLYYFGIASFGKRFRWQDGYIIGLIIIGFAPALASNVSATFSIRAMLTAVGFSYILARGLELTMTILLKRPRTERRVWIAAFALAVAVNGAFFAYNYYYRRPITIGELYNEKERQLAAYLIAHKDKQYTMYIGAPREAFLSYTFLDSSIDAAEVQRGFATGEPYAIGGLSIHKCPPRMNYLTLKSIIVEEGCMDKKIYDKMQDPKFPATRIPYADFSQKTAYFVIE